ncbi:hypothetical protein GCM10009678_17590 [Actinomadura kijaniata]|uniref:PH domain-containing protein n=1 Tax=Actinomadura namibiensis TaxID=182080 RepID=A0A7W3QIX8_ACTNM|nr:hypothetical protein [Actinomadura namibiensis]MBA8948760.1 hypothetical protein [Actinomadura namibiensis]
MESADRTTDTPAEPFLVRERPGWRAVWQFVAMLVLVVASVGFVGGAVARGQGLGSALFGVLGAVGIVLFGAGLLLSLGTLLNRRPVLELTAGGVRRPARWPLPRRADRVLPWAEVTAIAALRRGVHGTRRGEQDYLVFLPTGELAELARTAERPQLVALTLTDLPHTAPAARWCVPVDREALPRVVREARRRREVPVIDRRNR